VWCILKKIGPDDRCKGLGKKKLSRDYAGFLDHLQGAVKVAYFMYSAFAATPKMTPKTSKIV